MIAVLFYAVGIFILLLTTNTGVYGGTDAGNINRTAINLVSGFAAVVMVVILLFPWKRFSRETFFVVPTVGTVIISVCVYYSGGWESFPYALYAFAAVFCGIYFRPRLATLGIILNVVAGATPMLYQPDVGNLLNYLFVEALVFVTLAAISGYMVRQVVLRDRALRASEAELVTARREADLDGLTQISNRRHLENRLRDALEEGQEITLLFADIDDFKRVNDLHGHALGDEVLKFVASKLEAYARKTDLVARYGGEEFVVLMQVAAPDNARAFFERARKGIAVSSEERFGFPVRMSAGAASSRDFPEHERLLEVVDEAMYEAKHLGKDGIFVAGGPEPETTQG